MSISKFELSKSENNILFVPKGYASGFINKSNNSELLVFSTSTLENSVNDDYRFENDYFKNAEWKF